MSWIVTGTLLAAGAGLFVAPHGRSAVTRNNTLAGTALDLCARNGDLDSVRAVLVRFVMLAGCLAPFAPTVAVLVGLAVPASSRSTALLAAAAALAAEALLVTFVIAISHANFMFGGSSSRDVKPWAWVIPCYVAVCALVALVCGLWGRGADWLLG